MKNPVKIKAGIIILALALVLSACSKDPKANSSSKMEGDMHTIPNTNNGELRIITGLDGDTRGAGTNNGYYYLRAFPGMGIATNIMYLDYASGQEVYLSSDVQSKHDNESDTSYISSTVGDSSLFVVKEKLYFMRYGSASYLDMYGDKALPEILSFDLDGSNGKKLITL